MSEFEYRVVHDPRPAEQSRSDHLDLAGMSEVDLLLALGETGDSLDHLVALLEDGVDAGDRATEVCERMTDIEDELMRRGFSYEILST
jgi:hypothetical protein